MGDDLCVAQVQEWADGLEELSALIGRCFARSEPREHAMAYIRGLLSAEERKNSWTLSEQAGDATPNGMQRLLSTTDWDPDLVRDDLQRYVVAHLGDPGGVLIIDETGFFKKGIRSAGVARQYSGDRGADRELSDRGVPDLRHRGGANVPGPRVVPAQGMDRGPGPVRGGRHRSGSGVRDQTGTGHEHAATRPRQRGAGPVGDRGRGLRTAFPASRQVRRTLPVLRSRSRREPARDRRPGRNCVHSSRDKAEHSRGVGEMAKPLAAQYSVSYRSRQRRRR